MQGPDQDHTDITVEQTASSSDTDKVETSDDASSTILATTPRRAIGFDWLALGFVGIIAAFFALAGRTSLQPANSLTPIAVLSATGCGLLITALRKLRTAQRPGLLEAALAGLLLTLFQFLTAISYPTVLHTLSIDAIQRQGFFGTWGLVAAFTILFSIVGATLGHLAFAPLRPLPVKARPASTEEELFLEEELPEASSLPLDDEEEALPIPLASEDEQETLGEIAEHDSSHPAEVEENGEQESTTISIAEPVVHTRSLGSYFIAVLLLALAPTIASYVFSAAFDSMLNAFQLLLGPFPTLRLLSAMVPWQLPTLINISGNNQSSIILLLWRIPFFVGNPAIFDIQALEPFVFNGFALALLLLSAHQQQSQLREQTQVRPLSWFAYLLLEAELGLLLILPASLWILIGLQGLLQLSPSFVIPLRTLHPLNPPIFTLNLITGPLACVGMGLLIRNRRRRPIL